MLTKTMDYLDNFARFQKKENVEAVERLLSAHKEFHKFERAQLGTSRRIWKTVFPGFLTWDQRDDISFGRLTSETGTLCCADADEAKTLIPSLTDKISDEDLTELLEEMQKFR